MARRSMRTPARGAASVQVMGVDDSFWPLGNASSIPSIKLTGPDVLGTAINQGLAQEIGAKAGDEILARVQKPSAAARETFLGERDDTVVTLRLRVTHVLPSGGIGDFSLYPSQRKNTESLPPPRPDAAKAGKDRSHQYDPCPRNAGRSSRHIAPRCDAAGRGVIFQAEGWIPGFGERADFPVAI